MSTRIRTFEEYQKEYQASISDPEKFWEEKASEFVWRKKWDKVLEWDFIRPDVQWFIGGKLNIVENCLDRHLAKKGDQAAIIWEPNDPETEEKIVLTYKELHSRVGSFANV